MEDLNLSSGVHRWSKGDDSFEGNGNEPLQVRLTLPVMMVPSAVVLPAAAAWRIHWKMMV